MSTKSNYDFANLVLLNTISKKQQHLIFLRLWSEVISAVQVNCREFSLSAVSSSFCRFRCSESRPSSKNSNDTKHAITLCIQASVGSIQLIVPFFMDLLTRRS